MFGEKYKPRLRSFLNYNKKISSIWSKTGLCINPSFSLCITKRFKNFNALKHYDTQKKNW